MGNEASVMTPRPITHDHKGYAVISVKRGSTLHRDPTVLGLVVQRSWVEHPGLPVVIAVVDEVILDLEVRDE
jgi:hypothetical protein